MTRLLEQLIERLRALPENQQDHLAQFLLSELAEDERWASSMEDHRRGLEGLIDRLADDAAGRCEPMNPERL